MGSSSDRLFNRQRTIHQIFGGKIVANVVLWRQRNITMGILLMILTVWLAFEQSGYTLLSLTSSVLLLLITILFVWSKAASLLNRPAPPLPDMYLSKELVAEVGELARKNINVLVLVCRNVALGKDSRLFLRVAACLLLISVVGGFTDIVSLCYFCKFPLHIDCGLTTNRNIFWYFTTNRAVKFMDFPQFGES
ncbi:reticulon-like protein B12 isoform X1 [Spinacia oleracea]|uniref:Reticulon-like protein n=2 Tax=Spinacia oleracea TaxID=3562 RepID=A0A9R0J8S3_SPIOL|nr:reticulon-like protein B12 isoform X1 [Spinacia oleracea]